LVAASLVAAVTLAACGEATPPPAPAATDTAAAQDSGAGSDVATPADVDTGVDPGSKIESLPLQTVIKIGLGEQQKQGQLSGVVLHPIACTADKPCPLVVVIGDYDSDAYPNYEGPARKMAAVLPANVVIFNLPGSGPGSKKSEGEDDAGGPWHEMAAKEVMHLISSRSYVDKTRCGYLTIGTGLVPVASALKKFGGASLKHVQFLIDVEGPTDRCAMSQAPLDAAKGIGPGDGPGATDSACYFTKTPHSAMYPAASGSRPASIVCATGAWPNTKPKSTADCAAKNAPCGCDVNSWWSPREPRHALANLTARYQRLQFRHDHRLPSYWPTRHAIAAVAGSKSKFFALNNLEPCQSLPSDEDCATLPVGAGCWLESAAGNGLAPAPYAAGELQPISNDALFATILPGYVKRMIDDKAFPNCR